jgi:hypothetical protein
MCSKTDPHLWLKWLQLRNPCTSSKQTVRNRAASKIVCAHEAETSVLVGTTLNGLGRVQVYLPHQTWPMHESWSLDSAPMDCGWWWAQVWMRLRARSRAHQGPTRGSSPESPGGVFCQSAVSAGEELRAQGEKAFSAHRSREKPRLLTFTSFGLARKGTVTFPGKKGALSARRPC